MSAAPDTLMMRLRTMNYADLKEIIALEKRVYPFPWSETIFRDCIRVGYACWVVEGRVWLEGYGIMSVGAGECHVLNICIRPESRRMGLARRMLEHLFEQARAGGAKTVFLEVRPSNPRAIRLYRRIGFGDVGMRPNYYPGENGREDALVMAMEL